MQRLAGLVLLSSTLMLVACGDDGPSAPAPSMSGGAARGGVPIDRPGSGRDGGTADVDGGKAGSGAGSGGSTGSAGSAGSAAGMGGMAAPTPAQPNECETIDPVRFVGGDPTVDVVASTEAPEDFEVSRVVATWEADCEHPMIRVELSDGSCPLGKGHVLTFWLSAEAIDAGSIGMGLNTVLPEEPGNLGVKIRYTRPTRLTKPRGEWGTCRGAAATFNIAGEPPETTAFSDLNFSRFDLELTPCDGSDNDPIRVVGSFNVELQRGLTDVCPGK